MKAACIAYEKVRVDELRIRYALDDSLVEG